MSPVSRLSKLLVAPLAIQQWLPLATALIVLSLVAPTLFKPAAHHTGCVSLENTYTVCVTSDMAKITRRGRIAFEHAQFDLADNTISLTAARNETIAFQIIVRNLQPSAQPIDLSLGPITATTTGDQSATQYAVSQQWFAAHYHYIDDAGYTWGPRSRVLRWPDEYPDALVPATHQCGSDKKPLLQSLHSGPENTNQSLWIDTWFPTTMPPGTYEQNATVHIGQAQYTFKIRVDLLKVSLPDEPRIHAVGELYRTYRMEGIGENFHHTDWKRIAHCYQQLAHQHRMVFIERTPNELDESDWQRYLDIYSPILDGTLFSTELGYTGPGADTPVAIWRTPWPQEFDRRQDNRFDPTYYAALEAKARQWSEIVTTEEWINTDYFAYILDEVEGKQGANETDQERHQYLASLHEHMGQLQHALDRGSPTIPIDLIWTSHADPGQWAENPELDLSGKIRLWAPNASAANVEFLQHRMQQGDAAWFYHSGHPAIGVHAINASGIEMRTWGVIGAHYGFSGQLMWAVNLGNDDAPFADPSYKPDDDRVGNGVMVYPGNQLPRIGFPSSAGPIPSMRLKAWRRGLQDAELYYLAKSIDSIAATQAMETIMPRALSEGRGKAAWSQESADWIAFRQALLRIMTIAE